MLGRDIHVLEIFPNTSLTPRGALYFYLSLVAGTALVSGSVALMGYWPVLPFAGLELALLAFVLITVQKRGRYKEVVRISDEKIVVEKGENRVQERLEFVRHWSRVELRTSASAHPATKLWIRSHGRGCEIGRCLTDDERAGLAGRLREMIGPVNTSPPLTVPALVESAVDAGRPTT